VHWMIVSRTRAFGIIVILVHSDQSRRQPSVRPRPQTPYRLGATGGLSAANAREPLGTSQRLARCVAMWCDAQRRVVERCAAPRRAALAGVMSMSPTVVKTVPPHFGEAPIGDILHSVWNERGCFLRAAYLLSPSMIKPTSWFASERWQSRHRPLRFTIVSIWLR
jgi:hypothetical protein